MRAFHVNDAERIVPYFGDFGGMILPDAFSIELQDLIDDAKRLIPTTEFSTTFQRLAAMLPVPVLERRTLAGRNAAVVVKSQARYYIAAGHLALAACRKIGQASIGSSSDELLIYAAKASGELGIRLSVYLDRRQSGDGALKKALVEEGAVVDDTSCAKLYDRPYMYAFQQFIGNRAGSAFIADGAELGCYPFPALSGLFAEKFGETVRELLDQTPDTVAATIQNGNAALAAFRAFRDVDCRRITVEEPACQQFYADSYGSAMLSVRRAAGTGYNDNIAAELCNMWRMAEVVRLGAENYTRAADATERALLLIGRKLPACALLLLLEGEDE